jgi:hypothetical protein
MGSMRALCSVSTAMTCLSETRVVGDEIAAFERSTRFSPFSVGNSQRLSGWGGWPIMAASIVIVRDGSLA